MGRRRNGELPRYRLHKQSGQAVVSLPLGNNKYRDMLLGPFGSDESKQEYARVIGEWLASGGLVVPRLNGQFPDLTVSEICLLFWKHAQAFYRLANGSPSGELDHFKYALAPLKQLYGHTPAKHFGPVALKAIREKMIQSSRLCRKTINQRIEHIKRMFRWAASDELLPASIYDALRTVPGLRRGHPKTRETPKVRPVSDEHVEAILDLLCPQVAAMVQLQRLMGARSTEICVMRTRNIDRSGAVWWYRIDPNEVDSHGRMIEIHKTAHHETSDGSAVVKALPIGPKAQEVLLPFLRDNPDEYLFQPREARHQQNEERKKRRKSPMTPSQRARKQKSSPRRAPREKYDHNSYARAITRACELAGVPHWHPHQLKHSCGTEIRAGFGAEASQVFLGHSKLSTTEIYAEANRRQIEKIALELG